MECIIIKSPYSKEERQSNFYERLKQDTNDTNKAIAIFEHTLSKEYVQKYGDWLEGTSVLTVDDNGEPLINKSFLKTISNAVSERNELKTKLVSFINNMGFNYEDVTKALYNGSDNVSGVTDFLLQTVKVYEGADVTTLPEEAGHVYFEMLKQKQSPLYESILSEIVNYPIYQEVKERYGELYANDEIKLREEAVGKAIGRYIIKKTETIDSKLTTRLSNWFKRTLNTINSYVGINSEQLESFLDIATKDILSGTVKGVLNKTDYKLFDIQPVVTTAIEKIKEIDEKLIKKDVVKDGKTVERYFIDGVETLRISDKIAKLGEQRFGKEASKNTNIANEYARETGTLGHADVENVIKRYLEKVSTGGYNTPKTNNLGVNSYASLEKYVHNLLGQFAPNSTILTEVKVYNKKTNTAGTIDLLIIEPNGKTHIFDWKFVNALKDNVDEHKKQMWNIQLNSYKDALAEYGLKDIGMMRMMPISTTYNDNKEFVSISINEDNVFEKAQPAKNELTGDTVLNNLLNKLYNEYSTLSAVVEKTDVEKIRQKVILSSINRAINDIQINGSIGEFIRNSFIQINEFKKIIAEGDVSNENLLKMREFAEYYSTLIDLGLNKYDYKDDEGKPQGNINSIAVEASELNVFVKDELEKQINKEGIDKSWWGFNTVLDKAVTLGSIKNPIFQWFNRLKVSKEAQIHNEFVKYNEEIADLIEHLKKEEKDGNNLFSRILDKDKKGSLIRQYKKEFYDKLESADYNWLRFNIAIKSEAKAKFEEELKAKIEAETLRSPENADAAIKAFRYRNDFWSEDYKRHALLTYAKSGRNHRYLKPTNTWLTDEYKYLDENRDKAISKLYFKFQDTIEEARLYTSNYLGNSFIPSVEKSMIDKVLSIGSVGDIKNNVIDSLTMKSYEKPSDLYGNTLFKIPLRYTNELKGDKSLDLGTVFSMFYYSVLQNKHLTEIEAQVNLMTTALELGEYYEKDWKGDFKLGKAGHPEQVAISKSKDFNATKEQFKQFVNAHIYQIRDESKDFEFLGMSGLKAFGHLQSYFSMLLVGLKPVNDFANFSGGMFMLYSHANKNRHFNKSDVTKAVGLLTSANKTALGLVGYFDINTSSTVFKQANKLSVKGITKHFTLDKMFIGQHGGEWMVQNAGLLSFLNAHAIENNAIVKKTETNKSILESAKEIDGKIVIDGLTDEHYNTIRKRVKEISKKTMGSLSENEILLMEKDWKIRALMQFKKWMIPMGKERFGSLSYNDNLDEFEEGKFRPIINVFSGGVLGSIGNIKDLALSVVTKPNQSLLDKIDEMYNLNIQRNPGFKDKLTLEAYREMYIQNIRSAMFDLTAIVGVSILLTALGGFRDDDDEDKDAAAILNKFLFMGLVKTQTELNFWVDITASTTLTKGGIPLIGLLGRVGNLLSATTNNLFGDGEESVEDALARLTIVWSSIDAFNKGLDKNILDK